MADGKPQIQTNTRGLEVAEKSSPVGPLEKREKPETSEEKFQRERVSLAETITRERIQKLAEAREFNTQTLQELQRLDVKKRAKDQPREWGTFQAVTTVLLARLFAQDPKLTDGSPENIVQKLLEKNRLPRPEVATIIGILQQMNSPDALLKQDIRGIWPELLTLAREVAPTLPQIEAMEKKGWDFPLLEKARNGAVGFLQEHPNIRRVAIAAGALGALALLGKWIFGRKKEKTEGGGVFSKVLKVATVAVVAAFAYGYTKRHHKDWISWLKSWFKKEEEKPMFEKLAERVKMNPRLLERLGKESYVGFMKGNLEGDKGWGWVQTKITEGLGIEAAPTGFGKRTILGLGLPFSGLSIGQVNQVRNFLKQAVEKPEVRAELQQHNVDINNEKLTLATVFAVLNNMDTTGTLEKALVDSENPDNDPEKDIAVETDKENVVVVASKTLNELKEFAKDEAPHVRAVLEKWEKVGYAKIIWNMGDFAKDLVQAAEKEEKVALIFSGSQIILWNGLKYVVVASGDILVNTFKRAAEAAFLDKVTAKDALETYLKGTFEFMLIGGAIGFFRGVKHFGKFGLVPKGVVTGGIPGLLRGSFKGALFPFQVAWKTSRAGALVYHEMKKMPWKFKRVFTGAEAHAQYWAEQAKIEATAYRRWYQWRKQRIGHIQPLKRFIARHLIPEDIEAYTHRYGSRFANAYKRFADAYNKAFDAEIKAGTRKTLKTLDFDPNIDRRLEAIMEIVDQEFPEVKPGVTGRAPTTFEEALEAEKLRMDPKKTKLAKYWGKLTTFVGPAAAAATIYHLETASDKKKAVAETALGYAGFIAGVTISERTFAKAIKHPLWHGFAITLTGMAGAFGLTGGIEDYVNDYFLKFPGAYKASEEVAHMLELAAAGYIGKRTLTLAKSEVATKAAERIGLQGGVKALEDALMKKIASSTLVKRLGALTSKGILKKIAARLALKLGPRGAMLLAGHAVPGANVAALALDVILLPFFAKDMYDIVAAINDASKLNELMRERRNHPFVAVEILEPPDAKTKFGQQKTMLMQQGEGAILAFFDQFPHAKVRITRQDAKGDEIWTFKKGVVEGLAIRDEKGKEIVAMRSKDMERLGEKTFPEEKKKAA